jgi:hypothetical protein
VRSRRGESFLNDLKADRQNWKIRKEQPILSRINGINEVDMRKTPGIQMADLLGWTRHRVLTASEFGTSSPSKLANRSKDRDSRAIDLWSFMHHMIDDSKVEYN